MMDSAITYCLYLLDFLVTLAFSVFFCILLRQKEKNYGLFMIIILNMSYFLNGLYEITRPFFESNREVVLVLDLVSRGNYDFGMFWAAAFACFTHLVLNSRTYFNFRLFVTISLVLCLAAATIFPLAIAYNFQDIPFIHGGAGEIYLDCSKDPTMKQRIIFFLLDAVSTTVVPVLVTCYFYYRVYQTLKYMKAISFNKISSIRGHWFYMVPVICFLPSLIDDVFHTFYNTEDETLTLITMLMYRCWGVITLCGFHFLKPGNNDSFIEQQEVEAVESSLKVSLQKVRRAPTKSSFIYNRDSFDANIL